MLARKDREYNFFIPERLQETEILDIIQESYIHSCWPGTEVPSTYIMVHGLTSLLQHESLARAILKEDYDQDDIFGTFQFHKTEFDEWSGDLESYLNKIHESGYMMGLNETYRKKMRYDVVDLLNDYHFFFGEDDDLSGFAIFKKEKDINIRNFPIRKVW